GVTYAHKLTKEDGEVNWSASAVEIERKIRGMSPWPGVSASFLGHRVKMLKAIAINSDSNVQGEIGAITSDLSIICGRGLLKIELLQKAGSNAMSFEEFLRGVRQE
nr:methionyl-tRNA formyltransferase [Rickettsiaceae bacterium]